MRLSRTLALVLLTACAGDGGAEAFPVGNTLYFPQGTVDVRFVDKLVALQGAVVAIEKGPQEKPLFRLELAGVPASVWIASLVDLDNQDLGSRTNVRVLGYLRRVTDRDTALTAVTQDRYFVLGFCFVLEETERAAFLPAGVRQCEGWQTGKTAEELVP